MLESSCVRTLVGISTVLCAREFTNCNIGNFPVCFCESFNFGKRRITSNIVESILTCRFSSQLYVGD
jgi:hypothetical protein